MLADRFSALFADTAARQLLADLAGVSHTALPTFALPTTSLRHFPKWLDRLEGIQAGSIKGHGNFLSDPASIGLVDASKSPPILTSIGKSLLAIKSTLYAEPARGEYELVKLLYFSNAQHTASVKAVLQGKRGHMAKMLQQFVPTPNSGVFLSHPSLLVVAELLALFPGAVTRLAQMPQQDLVDLATLGEAKMKTLGKGAKSPVGLDRLCKRISGDFTRAQERRLHFVIAMCILTIASHIPSSEAVGLSIPYPFGNLLTPLDLHRFHAHYTQDITIWFDGSQFLISASKRFEQLVAKPAPAVKVLAFKPQTLIPGGRGPAAPNASSRAARRSARTPVTIVIDQIMSERAEDFVERAVVEPMCGDNYVRVGHRAGETLALPDGMVPGADFYAVDDEGSPKHYIEVKSVVVDPPCDVTLTRAEYLRAVRCAQRSVPYWLVLVNATDWRWWVVKDFAEAMKTAELKEVLQFTVKIG